MTIVDYRAISVPGDDEEQIRQEIFLTAREWRTTIVGALLGALAGVVFLAYLLDNNAFGQLAGPLLANTIYSALFTGAGSGLALGGLIGGLYAISKPFSRNFTGYTMLTLYCEPERVREAVNVVRRHGGTFL